MTQQLVPESAPKNDIEPPHSIEAEQCLLGAILMSDAALDAVATIVSAEDFYEPIHGFLFERMIRAKEQGRRLTLQLVGSLLSEKVKRQDIGGLTVSQYVAHLAAEATTIINAPDYARVIAEDADRRKIIEAADAMKLAACLKSPVAPASLAIEGMETLDRVAARYASKHIADASFSCAADRSIVRMQEAMRRRDITGIPTGLRNLDAKLNGLQRGDFIILAGRPGMGKSGLIISSLRQTAERGTNAHLFSLEMSAENVSDRMLSDACFSAHFATPYFDIARGKVSIEQAEAVIEAMRSMAALPIRIDPQGGLTVGQIAARARRHKQRLQRDGKTLDLLVVDHLHIIKPSSRYSGNRVAEITEISSDLKTLAKELNVPLVALAQLSRHVEGRDDKRPMLADLRDSGSLEQDADVIIFLYRPAYYLQSPISDPVKDQARIARLAEVKNLLEANVAKQRSGPIGPVSLFFDPASNAARNISLMEVGRAAA
jgi:replicative DNA helicase